jgi:hypothetical protein
VYTFRIILPEKENLRLHSADGWPPSRGLATAAAAPAFYGLPIQLLGRRKKDIYGGARQRERESPNISRSRRQQNVGHKNFTSVHSFVAQFHCKRKHFGPPEKTLGAAAKNSNPQLLTKLFFFLKQLLLHASA